LSNNGALETTKSKDFKILSFFSLKVTKKYCPDQTVELKMMTL